MLFFISVEISELIDDQRKLDQSPDFDGTKDFQKESLNEEIKEQLEEIVLDVNENVDDILVAKEKVDEKLKELADSEEAVDEVESLDDEEKKEIHDKLKNDMFNKLIEGDLKAEDHPPSNEVFVELIKEEEVIENLDISKDKKIMIEERLEEDLLSKQVSKEVDEALEEPSDDTSDIEIAQVQDAIENLDEKLQVIDDLDEDSETAAELKNDVSKDILQEIVNIYKPKDDESIQNRTDEVLSKLSEAENFVENLQEEDIIEQENEEVKANLEFNALEDIAEVVEDMKDDELSAAKTEVKVVEEDKGEFSKGKDIDEKIIDEAVDILDDNEVIEGIATPEKEAEIIDDLMEKERLIDHAGNLSLIEKAEIDIELEQNVAHELLEAKTKTREIDVQMENMHLEEEGEETDESTEEYHEDTTIETDEDELNSEERNDLKETEELINIANSRRKRFIDEIQEDIIKEIAEVSEDKLDEPNLTSKEEEKAEGLLELSQDLQNDLEAIESSDLNSAEKDEIEDKLSGDAMDVAEETMTDISGNFPDQEEDLAKHYVKENLKTFLEDVDIRRDEIAEDDLLGDESKVKNVEDLQKSSKKEIIENLSNLHNIVSQSDTSEVSKVVEEKVGDLYNELEENKLDVEAANISFKEKADIESKLDSNFANEVVDIVSNAKDLELDKINELKPYIKDKLDEKLNIIQDETDEVFLFTKQKELSEKIVNFTISTLLQDEIATPEQISSLNDQVYKLYNAFLQTAQIIPDENEIKDLQSDLMSIYIEYSKKLLGGQNELSGMLEIPTEPVPIKIDFTRKYHRETSDNIPGKARFRIQGV